MHKELVVKTSRLDLTVDVSTNQYRLLANKNDLFHNLVLKTNEELDIVDSGSDSMGVCKYKIGLTSEIQITFYNHFACR